MEIFCTMKVNDSDTGELLGKAETILTCDDCKDLEEVADEYGEDIEEYLANCMHPDTFTGNYVVRVDLVELAEDYEGETA